MSDIANVATNTRNDLKGDINYNSQWVKRWLRARAVTGRRTYTQDDEEAVRKRLLLDRLGQSFARKTLQWLTSISSTTPSGQPFSRKGKEASIRKYKSIGHRYLGFCWKAYGISRQEALERWAVYFTDKQWSLLYNITDELKRDRVPSSHDGGFSSGFSSGRERQAFEKDEDEYPDDDNSDKDERGNEARFVPNGIRRIVVAIYRIASSNQEGTTVRILAQRAR
ncbi:hypothetical protein V8F33_014190 [Rhypophila sp. PSN 637]